MNGPSIVASDGVAVESVIKPRDRDAVITALRAGVVPRVGLNHIQVGRLLEVEQVVKDVGRITSGASAVRFIIGDYGSGKTFFLNLARSVAMQSKMVVVHADLSPDRRIHATGGQARALYSELMRNMATRNKPEGGAISAVVEKFIQETVKSARLHGRDPGEVIHERLAPLQELVSGYDFAVVIERYWSAFDAGNDDGKAAALRWLRGEYTLKTEAREALGVRSIIEDASIYDSLKVMGRFVRIAGYEGFLVVIDEAVNIFKLVNALARNSNYEQILRIVNDVLQGSAEHFGVYFGGTPEFLLDSRRGLYSYEALRSRLAENTFARAGIVDMSGPVIRLQALTPEELFVLLGNLRKTFAGGEASRYLVPDEALHAFLDHCGKKIGAAYFRTPRNTIKGFLDLLAVLEQHPGLDWTTLIGGMEIARDTGPVGEEIGDDGAVTAAPASQAEASTTGGAGDDLASFKL
jgi:hypothetical protein